MIKFGISENYVPGWGVVQAIREVYQNFIDYGEFNVEIDDIGDDKVAVHISNDFKPETWEFLKIGFSKKKDGSIGKHGEGLKLAGLIFLRNGLSFSIGSSAGVACALFYEDDSLGKCYGLKTSPAPYRRFEVCFECDKKDIQVFNKDRVKEEDILHKSGYGCIVDKLKGNIYVGGLYVCNVKDLKYAIDFKSAFMELGRDREVPSTFDLEYFTNKVINSCSKELKLRASDVYNREFNQGDIPAILAKKFTPVVDSSGAMRLQSGKTIITDKNLISKISKNKDVAKKIEKLKYNVVFKSRKSPATVLKELKRDLYLTTGQEMKLDTVIRLSQKWRNK
ncbi:hypothetical protein KA005_08945 [bacterium]|nr:hypothetical protein [bacterium]